MLVSLIIQERNGVKLGEIAAGSAWKTNDAVDGGGGWPRRTVRLPAMVLTRVEGGRR